MTRILKGIWTDSEEILKRQRDTMPRKECEENGRRLRGDCEEINPQGNLDGVWGDFEEAKGHNAEERM
jgi:hypothetical protein